MAVLTFQCRYQGSSFITVLVSGANIKVSNYCHLLFLRCKSQSIYLITVLVSGANIKVSNYCHLLFLRCKSQGISFITVLVSGGSIKVSHSSLSLCCLFSASIKVAHSLLCWFQVQVSRYLTASGAQQHRL